MKSAFVTVAIILANTCAFADDTSILDKITKNIKDVCQSPDSRSSYWDVSAKAGGGTNKLVKLVGIGVNAEASFSKKEWDGVQKVLKTDQAKDNENYRKCVSTLTPLFLNKFVPEKTKTKKKYSSSDSGKESAKVRGTRENALRKLIADLDEKIEEKKNEIANHSGIAFISNGKKREKSEGKLRLEQELDALETHKNQAMFKLIEVLGK